jgi:hypothetical protein
MTNIRKRQKSQDSRIKTLFAEIFNFKSYFCKLCMVTVNDIVGKLLKAKYKKRKCQEICKEILQFLAGNIAINKLPRPQALIKFHASHYMKVYMK